jgi:Flp pilus assembly protein TadD
MTTWTRLGAVGSAAGAVFTCLGIGVTIWLYAPIHNTLTPLLENRLNVLVHEVYHDRNSITEPERARLTAFAKDHGISQEDLALAEQAIRSKMNLARSSISRGIRLVAEQRYDQARLEFRSATESDPGDANAWSDLAAADALLGQLDSARGEYEKALALDPANWLASYNLGLLFVRQRNPEAALKQLDRSLALLRESKSLRPQLKTVLGDLQKSHLLDSLRADSRFQSLLVRN